MKITELKLHKRRYKKDGFAPSEFVIIKYIGDDWIVATNEQEKEVIFIKDPKEQSWEYFDDEILD